MHWIISELIKNEPEWWEAGRQWVIGLWEGIKAEWENFKLWMGRIIDQLIAEIKAKFGIHSRSQVMYDIGEDIARGLIEGIKDTEEELSDVISAMFDFANALANVGRGAMTKYKREVLDPLAGELEALDERIEKLKEMGGVYEYPYQYEELVKLERERAEVASQYADAQERAYKLRVAQENLSYLQQQFRLLELISDYGLDAAAILDGLTLGIDANLEDMIDAMTRAIQAIVQQVEDDLGMGSPSKVFENIGAMMMGGLARGVTRSMEIPGIILRRAIPQMIEGGVSNTSYNMTVNTNARSEQVQSSFNLMRVMA
jgi:hypothetical protein